MDSVYRKDEGRSSGKQEYREGADDGYYGRGPCPAQAPEPMVQSSLQNLAPFKFTAQRPEVKQYTKLPETTVTTEIAWRHEGHLVAIKGSWDNWSQSEYLHRSYGGLTRMKVLPVGVYYYLFFVDGNWTFAPDVPHVSDNQGNIFNILDLQINHIKTEDNTTESESSSPPSSYNNEHFSLQDFRQKVPELPLLLHSTPLNHQNADDPEFQAAPLTCVLNHLFLRKPEAGESLTALGSTQCFRQKYTVNDTLQSAEYYVTDTLQVAGKVAGPEFHS